MGENAIRNRNIHKRNILLVNKSYLLFILFCLCLLWFSLSYGLHPRHYYFECPQRLLQEDEEAARESLTLYRLEQINDEGEIITVDYLISSEESCGSCLTSYYPNCRIKDIDYIPRLNPKGTTKCAICCAHYWRHHPDPYVLKQVKWPIYAGYLHFFYNEGHPFLERQINYTKKYPQYQAYWPETSQKASTICALACNGMNDIFNSTKLNIIQGDKSLESSLPVSSPFYVLYNNLPIALVANCFRFSDFHQVFYDLSEYVYQHFRGNERRIVLDKLDDLLDQIYTSYIDLYEESMRLHPTQEMAEEIEFMNLYKNNFDKINYYEADLYCMLNHSAKKNGKQVLKRTQTLFASDSVFPDTLETPTNEKKEINFFQANLEFMKGYLCNESLLYHQAIAHFNSAIKHNPSLRDAYLECAYAHFELENIKEAINYYNKAKRSTNKGINTNTCFRKVLSITSEINYTDSNELLLDNESSANIFEYSCGLVAGTLKGAKESTLDFLPSTFSTLTGIGQGLWAFVCSPQEISSDIIEASLVCIDYLSTHGLKEIAEEVVPELQLLINQWRNLSYYEKGDKFGYVIGKYGVAILGPGMAVKAIKNYRSLKRANTMLTLQACSQSQEKKFTVLEKIKFFLFNRKLLPKHATLHWDRQCKHIPGKHNFIPGKSVVTLQREEIETLIRKFAGKGERLNEQKWGTANYQERINFGQIIGTWVEEGSTVHFPTTNGKIVYDKKWQMHLVPLRPTQKR